MGNYSKVTVILSVAALLLSLALVHVAESRVLIPRSGPGSAHEDGKAKPVLVCTNVYGAEAGDTCFSVTKAFNLTTDFFNAFNPNLNCDKIFVAEWLCVDGFSF